MRQFVLFALLTAACSNHPPEVCETPDITAAMVLDPANLMCEVIDAPCNDECGLCPAQDDVTPVGWGPCVSQCNGLDETTCGATSGCRISKRYEAYYSLGAQGSDSGYSTDYFRCLPVDTGPPPTSGCTGDDADGCATDSACVALYSEIMSDAEDLITFEQCVPAAQQSGACTGSVICELAISCPSGTTPGIADGCYTGSCIPDSFCPH